LDNTWLPYVVQLNTHTVVLMLSTCMLCILNLSLFNEFSINITILHYIRTPAKSRWANQICWLLSVHGIWNFQHLKTV